MSMLDGVNLEVIGETLAVGNSAEVNQDKDLLAPEVEVALHDGCSNSLGYCKPPPPGGELPQTRAFQSGDLTYDPGIVPTEVGGLAEKANKPEAPVASEALKADCTGTNASCPGQCLDGTPVTRDALKVIFKFNQVGGLAEAIAPKEWPLSSEGLAVAGETNETCPYSKFPGCSPASAN